MTRVGEKAPYFRFFVFDWDSDFVQRSLTPAGAGIYIRLMVIQWIEGALPDDVEALATYVGANEEDWTTAWAKLGKKFPRCEDGLRRNRRLEEERRHMEEVHERKKKRARSAANARWSQSSSNAQASGSDARALHGDANQEPEPEPEPQEETLATPPEPLRLLAEEIPDKTPKVYWDTDLNRVVLDEDWLRNRIFEFQESAGCTLMRSDYEAEVEALNLKLLADPRLRACIRKRNGKPSTSAQFARMKSFVETWFLNAIQKKARRAKSRGSPNSASARSARTDSAFREAMNRAKEKAAK